MAGWHFSISITIFVGRPGKAGRYTYIVYHPGARRPDGDAYTVPGCALVYYALSRMPD